MNNNTKSHTFTFTIDQLERICISVAISRNKAREHEVTMEDTLIFGSIDRAEAHWEKVDTECVEILEMLEPFLNEVDFQENWLKDSLDDHVIEKFLEGE